MSTSYLLKTPDLEFDEMVKFMDQSDETFITRQIILNNDKTYDEGFVITTNNNIMEIVSAKRVYSNQQKRVCHPNSD